MMVREQPCPEQVSLALVKSQGIGTDKHLHLDLQAPAVELVIKKIQFGSRFLQSASDEVKLHGSAIGWVDEHVQAVAHVELSKILKLHLNPLTERALQVDWLASKLQTGGAMHL
jgi:hypothetical protein